MATELFNAGRDLMTAGNFAAACPKLAESARLDVKVGTLGKLAEWRAESLVVRTKLDAPSIAPEPSALTDFQEDYLEARDAVLGSLTPRERNALAAQVAAVSLSP